MRSFLIFITGWKLVPIQEVLEEKSVPFRLYVPSGRLSGPILKPERCFLGFEASAPSSSGLLGAMVEFEVHDGLLKSWTIVRKVSGWYRGH